ncbi:MAG: CCA tRNA nucleotidyltransferase [Bdellovibrionales bacterium]|nr:CCA tRNA nucleotidyltransferase [Bdellovibrionales bacterium]
MISVEFNDERIRLLEQVQLKSQELQLPCFLIGGFVRDLLHNRRIQDGDIDIVVEGAASLLASSMADHVDGTVKHFKTFLTAKVLDFSGYEPCVEIDFASARSERYPKSGALPIVAPSSVTEDLRRRDFTVNAMAVPLDQFLHLLQSGGLTMEKLQAIVFDPFDGQRDLQLHQIRILHSESFVDDPTRIVRLVRYKVRLNFAVEKLTEEALKDALKANALQNISVERLWNELVKCLFEADPGRMIVTLAEYGAFIAHHEAFLPFRGLSLEEISLYAEQLKGLSVDSRVELTRLLALGVTLRDGEVEERYFSQLSQIGVGKKERKRLQGLIREMFPEGTSKEAEDGISAVELIDRYVSLLAGSFGSKK